MPQARARCRRYPGGEERGRLKNDLRSAPTGDELAAYRATIRDLRRRDVPLLALYHRWPKPYVSVKELTELTPWTEEAIRTMMRKTILVEGKHYFRVGRRDVFKWEAIVDFIERRHVENGSLIPLRRGGFLGGAS
jgi:hypothetical protein